MAKKEQSVKLENRELEPQVIGYSYKKKSNIGRVIFIFIAFIIVIYYINDISVFINNLLGKKSASSIQQLADEEKEKIHNNKNEYTQKEQVSYYQISNNLEINVEGLTLNSFLYTNNILTFDAVNKTNKNIDLSNKNYFLEIYNENKTLLNRYKLDIKSINANTKTSFEFNINSISYIVVAEKTINDYPEVTLTESNGVGLLTCYKDDETIVYTFSNNELMTIKHSIVSSDINASDYQLKESLYQSKVNTYNNMTGITATFNSTVNGYSAIFTLSLDQVNLVTLDEKYYYGYKELAKVVKFEMQTYGFSCS